MIAQDARKIEPATATFPQPARAAMSTTVDSFARACARLAFEVKRV